MLNVVTLFWEPNEKSQPFSTCYTPEWVERLYRGFARNLTVPFRFVCFTEKERTFAEPIEVELLSTGKPSYANCIEPYRLGQPMILVGLDTVIVGNCDHFAEHALSGKTLWLPRDPYQPERACNGVAIVPAGMSGIYARWQGENDMDWLRKQPHQYLDDEFPGQVLSYKVHVRKEGMARARIVYFHGIPKMDAVRDEWVKLHWR